MQKRAQRKKMSFARATLSVLGESAEGFRIKLSITSQDIARAVICGVLIILFTMLQTTIFVRFPLFGAVPDLMLALTIAIAFSEGERYGAVCGLISAFVIESVGGVGMTLLPLLYMPAGFFCGVLAKNYLSDSIPSRAALICICGLGRMIITLICASILLNATFVEIIWKIAIPEYFSTLVMSILIFALVWVSMKNFHKTRAEKTENLRP